MDKEKYKGRMSPEDVIHKVDHLKAERGTFESLWQEVADYFIPNRAQITTKKYPGQRDDFILLDNIGIQSNEILAGVIQSLLTNVDAQWFEFTTGDLALDNDDEVRLYMQRCVRALHNIISNSNFHTESHELFLDLPSLGTSCMLVEEDENTVIRHSTKEIADYLIDEDRHGEVNQVYYSAKFTANQLIKQFGEEKLPERVLKCRDKEEKFCVIHAVYPEYLCEPTTNSKKFVSQYIIREEKHEIEHGQYHELPYMVPRYSKRAGEKYGRSPAMTALPEMRVLNKMNETLLIGMQKQVDPPLQVEDDGVILPLVTRPGGINYRRTGSDPIQPLFTGTRVDIAYQALTERRQRVRDAFNVDQLRLSQDMKYMSATEVLQRTEDSMRLLGPLMGRMTAEFLRKYINRVFRIADKQGKLPEPPLVLQGKNIDVKYSSLIAKSQRVSEGQALARTVEAITPFIQMDQQVVDNFNGDALLRIAAGIYGFPQEGLRSAQEIAQIREQRQQALLAQEQMMQQAAMESQEISNMATMAKAQKDLNGGNR